MKKGVEYCGEKWSIEGVEELKGLINVEKRKEKDKRKEEEGCK